MILSTGSFTISPLSKIDHVHLRVSNLQESVNFYQSILGFEVLIKKPNDNTTLLTSAPNNDEKNISLPLLCFNRTKW
jgi:catechol 2,3-dioxygenase-like lactoylglutathione lyase family enzyme